MVDLQSALLAVTHPPTALPPLRETGKVADGVWQGAGNLPGIAAAVIDRAA